MKRKPRTLLRSGIYYRVVAPNWANPADTTYSKQRGGRWNPPHEFGALYLNATVAVAAANARAQHSGRAIKLFDLLPKARPELATFLIPEVTVLDACTADGVAILGFVASFPYEVDWPPCQAIARTAHTAGLNGVAARSHAEVREDSFVGEELALFEETAHTLSNPQTRSSFAKWYPDPIPGS